MSAALVEGGVANAEDISPNQGKGPVQISGELKKEFNLAVAARAVNAASTPHKSQSPPGLAVVLFADLDKASAKTAKKALSKVKGVDAKGTRANAKKGQISVKLSGGEKDKVKLADLVSALKKAGIEAKPTKG